MHYQLVGAIVSRRCAQVPWFTPASLQEVSVSKPEVVEAAATKREHQAERVEGPEARVAQRVEHTTMQESVKRDEKTLTAEAARARSIRSQQGPSPAHC